MLISFPVLFKSGLSVLNIISEIVTSYISDFNFSAILTTFLAISFGGIFDTNHSSRHEECNGLFVAVWKAPRNHPCTELLLQEMFSRKLCNLGLGFYVCHPFVCLTILFPIITTDFAFSLWFLYLVLVYCIVINSCLVIFNISRCMFCLIFQIRWSVCVFR